MNSKLKGHLLVLFCVLVWGVTFVSTKILLQWRSPVEIALDRFVLAYVLLLAIHPVLKRPQWREELYFFGLGLFGVTLYFLTENIALQYTQASSVGLLVSSAPLLTAFFAHFTTHDEKLSARLIIGSLVALAGVALVMFNGSIILKLNPLGDILALSAGAAWAVYSLMLKRAGQRYGYLFLTRQVFFYGILTLIPAAIVMDYRMDLALWLNPIQGVNMAFLGIVASALCYVAWNKAVGIIGAVKASNYIYIIPMITMLTAVIILKERITLVGAAGASLILLGVYYAEHGLKLPTSK
ncbi:DMT family transporter [Chitinibacter bivalviorum]|uniref:DMT family transporter n=1 Tax=Chitinibacter bivalviorum TaxID=2739434 RepID=A0A7H9BJ23_9NEIS|nr:DMT family transporter [Chitinibacter bivalviorum]QLG88479.1 DMT family transporter [Chitinibacter bivalviorum]